MELPNGLGEMAIKDVVQNYPGIGRILKDHDIACITCQVGICLFKDVVGIHGLSAEDAAKVEAEILAELETKGD